MTTYDINQQRPRIPATVINHGRCALGVLQEEERARELRGGIRLRAGRHLRGAAVTYGCLHRQTKPLAIQRLETLEEQYSRGPSPDRRPIGGSAPAPITNFDKDQKVSGHATEEVKHLPATQTLQVPTPRVMCPHLSEPFGTEQQERGDGSTFAQTAYRMRRWGITQLIDRLEERAASYRINTEYMPKAIPEPSTGSEQADCKE